MIKRLFQLLEGILRELKNIHFHMDRLDAFFKMAYHIKEDEKTGAWIEDSKAHEDGNGDRKG